MLPSLLWGGIAALSLVLGAVLALLRRWSDAAIGVVLAFGAGALIASVSFELFQGGLEIGGPLALAIGLALGAVAFLLGSRGLQRLGGSGAGGSAGLILAFGAFLDGIPEQLVLGLGLADGSGVSIGLLVAIFVSNLPESIGSAGDMLAAGRTRREVLALWAGVAIACVGATVVGTLVADEVSGSVQAGVDGFAAGALLVMLIDSMIPEAKEKAGDRAGLATVLGFAVAAGLSLLS